MVCGTITDQDGFDAQQDSEILHKAMKGLGTDEAKIIGVVAHRSNKQRQELKKIYAQMWGKPLVDALKSELGGHFEDAVVALFRDPVEFDAWALHDAMHGAGTTESTLIEIMCSRSNAEIKAIIAKYKTLYKSDLAKDLQGETSGYFKRLLYSLAQASRNDGDDVDSGTAEADAKALFDAGEKQWGTDESRFQVILGSRSNAQLQLIFQKYEKISKKTMEAAIKSEMSGSVEDGFLAVVKVARNLQAYFAERLYKSMKGAGTNDKALIRLMISRSEVDLHEIKEIFQSTYGQSLEAFINDDISGDYKRLLIQLCRGNRH